MAVAPCYPRHRNSRPRLPKLFSQMRTRLRLIWLLLVQSPALTRVKAAEVFIHGLLGINPLPVPSKSRKPAMGPQLVCNGAKSHHRPVSKPPRSWSSPRYRWGMELSLQILPKERGCCHVGDSRSSHSGLHDDNVCQTRDIMDFWRPNEDKYPRVDGRFSTVQYYQTAWTTTLPSTRKGTGKKLADFAAMCLHPPSKQDSRAQAIERRDEATLDRLTARFQAIVYNKVVGNITLALSSSLSSPSWENSQTLKAGDDILFYRWQRCGSVNSFLSGLVEGVTKTSWKTIVWESLNQRTPLTVEDYEALFFEEIQVDETGAINIPTDETGLPSSTSKHYNAFIAKK